MQNFKPGSLTKACLALLSLTFLTQAVCASDGNRISYLDSVSTSYMHQPSASSLLNINSADARGVEASINLDSSSAISNSNARINLSLRDSDLKQTLRMLAEKAKINIVFDKSVDGKITLDLKNITVNDAFKVIFKSSQLTYSMDGNTLTVMTIDASKEMGYGRQNMTVLPVKYVSADSVAAFLNDNLFKSNIFGLSNRPVVTSNPRNNQIVVFGTYSDVAAIKRILPVLDTKPLVNSFKVNHTTPKEMATLLCDSLMYKSGNDDDVLNEDTEDDNTDDDGETKKVVLGGGFVACRDMHDDIKNALTEGKDDKDKLSSFIGNPLTVMYFPELGTVGTYGGSVEQVEVIKDFIKEHDKKQLMAYVELSVVELNETGSKDFSNEWNLWTPFISLGFNPSEGLTTSSASPFFIWGNQYPVQTTTQQTDSSTGETTTSSTIDYVNKTNNRALTYKLKYLIENGNGRVLTNPKIMVTNGKKAVIDMTSDYVKSVTSQVLEGSTGVTSATQRTYDIGSDLGLLIEIVPFISPDGYVSMNISPEFATVKERVYSVNDRGQEELAATLLQRRDLELKNIRIRDGETLVLAGLIKESESQTVKKMPILSDLPFIGVFFRGNQSTKDREELVIVVTPHIVKDTDDVADDKIYDL